MNYEKDKNLTRFLLTFFLGWIGSIIINCTNFKPKGYKSRTLAYFFLSCITFGIYGLVAAISNLSFDPTKESNIGYAKEEGYVYNVNSDQNFAINYVADDNHVQANKSTSINMFIKKIIVLIMAFFSLLTLQFTLCEFIYVENGFTFMTFQSFLIGEPFSWAIYLIGAFSILFFLISLTSITLSILNFFIQKRFNFNLIIIIASIFIAVLYMIIGIALISVCMSTYGDTYYAYHFKISAYIPLIIQAALLVVYIICCKIKLMPIVSTKNKASDTTILSRAVAEEQQINKYKEMLDKGIITEEEFNEKRKKILGL